jgi:hypothetical protein
MSATQPKTLTLVNTFHGTQYRTRKTREELDALEPKEMRGETTKAEQALLARIRMTLCGVMDCQCGRDFLNERAR